MAVIAWTDVVFHAAELSTVATEVQDDVLAYVNSVVQVALIDGETGPKTKLARIYLAAHYATANVNASAGISGAVTMKKEGDVQIGYAPYLSFGAAHKSTLYGQMYLALIRSSALRAPVLL